MSLGRYLPRLSYVSPSPKKSFPPSPGDISCASAPTPYQAPQRPNRPLAHSGYHKCTLQHTCCMSPQIRQRRAPTIRSWVFPPAVLTGRTFEFLLSPKESGSQTHTRGAAPIHIYISRSGANRRGLPSRLRRHANKHQAGSADAGRNTICHRGCRRGGVRTPREGAMEGSVSFNRIQAQPHDR